jgi:uncharacterized membrane protein YozB (DUF420 family)
MAVAWFLNIVSFILVMVPSLITNVSTFTDPETPIFNASSIVHIPIGIAAFILSTYLVLRWAFNSGDIRKCFGKGLMRATMITWMLSLIIGIVIYLTMPS